ncbi:MAG TPA: GAF domain-containing protein, partial [Pyrinomonadaceae bacterium]|nr:GAF domain-containing protein [Pyrinomonadaceae bacterium]
MSTDIATDPVWAEYRDLALGHGLRACWSTPIINSMGDVLGTFGVYYREPREPNPQDLQLIQLMTRTAAIAIERERSEEARREGEEHHRLLFENSRDALLIADDNGKYLRANRAASELLGYPREQLLKMGVSDLITTDAPDANTRYEAYLNSEYETGEFSFIRPDGERRTAEYVANRLAPGMHLSALRDVTERKLMEAERERLLSNEQSARTEAEEALRLQRHIEERLMLLVEASSVLLGSPTLQAVQPAVLDLSRRLIAADAYAIWRVDHANGLWSTVAQAGLSPDYDRQSLQDTGNANALLESPLIAEDVTKVPSLAARQEIYHAEGIKSLLAVPLRIHGVISGTLTFYYRQPHRFIETEVRVATTLANLAGSAVSSAELYEEQRRMRAEAEDAERRAHYLAEASRVLSSTLDYQTTLAQVARLSVPDLADWCAVDIVGEGGDGIVRLAVAHADPEKVEWANELASRYSLDMDAPHGVPNVLRTGRSELYSQIPDEMLVAGAIDDEHLRVMREIGFA